ncbi:MAG: DUF2807 domain-containing protein [Paludibacter sp.]|nr:DUF2807 domain-containing protein [Paludibacter sp.]
MKAKLISILVAINMFSMTAQVIKETRIDTKDNISCIKLNTLTQVILKNGDSYKVEVETDKQYLPYIKTIQKDSTIEIYTDAPTHTKKMKHCNIYITVPNMPLNIKANAISNIQTTNNLLKIDNLNIDANAIATIKLNLITETFNCVLNAVSTVEIEGASNHSEFHFNAITNCNLSDFKIKDLYLTINSSVTSDFYVSHNFKLDAKSVLNLNIFGHPTILLSQKIKSCSVNIE